MHHSPDRVFAPDNVAGSVMLILDDTAVAVDEIADGIMVEMQVQHSVGDQARVWRNHFETPERYRMFIQ